MRNRKPLVWLSTFVMLVSMFAIVACTSGGPKQVEQPTPNENGIITAEQWKDMHPDIYASYQQNSNNSTVSSYLTQYPFLVTIYDGTGFAKDYSEARGHVYTLQDIADTQRPHAAANCLTCKTPEMTALVNSQGVSIYSADFVEIYSKVGEPVSCYNCHENTGDQLVVTAGYLKDALGSDISKVDPKMLSCAQCHNEYYFDPTTKATTLPWVGLNNMTPDAILAYYNTIGFSDNTNSFSGATMIKVQHPEFETVMGIGSQVKSMGNFTCASCHMGTATNANGEEYISHYWVSPLKNEDLLKNVCSSCHANLAADVAVIQSTTKARLVTIGEKLADLHMEIGKAAADGVKSEGELAELRSLIRDAQFYYDFCFVENSDGAHNSAMTKDLLDKSEDLIDQALAKL